MRHTNLSFYAVLSLLPLWAGALGCGGSSAGAVPDEGGGPGAGEEVPGTPDAQPIPEDGDDSGQREEPARAPFSLTSCSALEQSTNGQGWIFFDSDGDDFNRDLYRVLPDGTGLTRLTSEPSIEKEPAVSPDGLKIAFTSDRSGTPQLYVLELDAEGAVVGEPEQLTQRPGGADQPTFSRDGTRIAFHSGSSVYTIASDGSDERFVAAGLDDFNAYFWPSFSADGSELLIDRNNEIKAINLATGVERYVVSNTTTTIKYPAVSPSGTAVAYSVWCDGGGNSIWTTPFSSPTESCKGRRVTPVMNREAQRPSWGPGDTLAYELVDETSNVAHIAVISRTAGALHCNLTPGPGDSRNPAWHWQPTLQ